MCLQCATDAASYGEVLEGWFLMKSTKPHPDWDGWALVQCNDPTYVWNFDLIKDPEAHLTEDEVNEIKYSSPEWHRWEEFYQITEKFNNVLRESHPVTGWELVNSCIKAGYDLEEDGHNVAYWLTHFLAVYLENNPFPEQSETVLEGF